MINETSKSFHIKEREKSAHMQFIIKLQETVHIDR